LFLLVFFFALQPSTGFGNELFPLYPKIKNNVRFWEKIYSTYSLNDAVIHDSENLSIIYEIVPLLDPALPGAQRINRLARQQARDKYVDILNKIFKTKQTITTEEKRVAAFFKGSQSFAKMLNAAKNVRIQTGQKERFLNGVFRSKAYIKHMKTIFRSYGLPEDLAYIPHVESSFNVKAYSKFGAAGMWQFTRGTGKQYLTINYSIDERLDPILATRAAARYLKKSYRALNNWPLAITSYNYGTAGMRRAVKAKGSYEKIFTDYNRGHFKFASKNFYSEFLAALKVAKRIETGNSFKNLHVPSVYSLKMKGYAHINHIKTHFRLNQSQVEELNPALRPPIFTGEKLIPKGYFLRLPGSKKTNNVINSISPSLYVSSQKRSTFHRVKRGDTAGSIAKLHGVSVKKLTKINNLDRYATIYIRQKLRIPSSSTAISVKREVLQLKRKYTKQLAKHDQDENIPLLTANKKNRPSGSRKSYIPPKDPALYDVYGVFKKNKIRYGYITVQPEESLGLYAQWLGTTMMKLRSLNNFNKFSALVPGQKLLLAFGTLATEQLSEKRLDYLTEIEDDFFRAYTVTGKKIYKVNSGDTFWDLCYNKFDVPLWLLERYNSSLNLSKLKSSQELIIPILKTI